MGDDFEANLPALDDWGGELSEDAVRELDDDAKRQYMEAWFRHYFEDPAHSLPYVSAEGGYQWVTGGPYDAREKLYEEFEGAVSEELIEQVAQHLDGYGHEWAPSANHPDRSDERREPEEPEQWDPDLDDIIEELEAGAEVHPDEPGSALRASVLERLDALEAAVAELGHGGMGHNRPPEGLEDVEPIPPQQLDEIAKDIALIREEIAKPQPDTLGVARRARDFREVGKWLAAKLDLAADEAAKVIGKGVGGAILVGGGIALGIGWHAIAARLAEAAHAIAVWAATVTAPF